MTASTLSVICSPLPRKSARASDALPVTRRQVKSRTADGSSSKNNQLNSLVLALNYTYGQIVLSVLFPMHAPSGVPTL